MLRSLGIRVEAELYPSGSSVGSQYITRLYPPDQINLPPLQLSLPGDPSAAAFLIVAALVTPESEITLQRVGMNPTRTGLIDTLLEMGADIQVEWLADDGGEPIANLTVRSSSLEAVAVSGERIVRMIDEFPIFAIAAACSLGTTRVKDAAELRTKESDRITTLCIELRKLGVEAVEASDGFTIEGGRSLSGGTVQAHGDHRLAMALAVAGLAAQAPVTVQDAEIAAESFPTFTACLTQLGAQTSSR
jgi:3-phosphoshikimate 1-carboxyvinyltransferase